MLSSTALAATSLPALSGGDGGEAHFNSFTLSGAFTVLRPYSLNLLRAMVCSAPAENDVISLQPQEVPKNHRYGF